MVTCIGLATGRLRQMVSSAFLTMVESGQRDERICGMRLGARVWIARNHIPQADQSRSDLTAHSMVGDRQ